MDTANRDETYGRCRSCGAEIYDDGAHVLDEYDRESNGYPKCAGPFVDGVRFEPTS